MVLGPIHGEDLVDVRLEPLLRRRQVVDVTVVGRFREQVRSLVARAQRRRVPSPEIRYVRTRVSKLSSPGTYEYLTSPLLRVEVSHDWMIAIPRCATFRLSCRWLPWFTRPYPYMDGMSLARPPGDFVGSKELKSVMNSPPDAWLW